MAPKHNTVTTTSRIEGYLDQLKERAHVLRQRAAGFLREARETAKLVAQVTPINGSEWRDVDRDELEEGRLYIVRRILGRNKQPSGEPCIAEWVEGGGWAERCGRIPPSVGPPPQSLQVWVSKTRKKKPRDKRRL